MKKMTAIFAMLLAVCLTASAGERAGRAVPLVTGGLDWGFTGTVFNYRHVNCTAGEGYRINEVESGWGFHGNAYVLACIGANVSDRMSVLMECGYMGINGGRRINPFMVKACWHPSGVYSSGAFCFAEGGVGFAVLSNFSGLCSLGSVGWGYRVNMGDSVSVDFQIRLRAVYDKPDIADPDTGTTIPAGSIHANDAYYGSLNFGLALNF